MKNEEVEKLRQAMLKVIANLSEHDLRNIANLDDCYYCPKCIKGVCPTRNMNLFKDSILACETAWIEAAKDDNIQCEKIKQELLRNEAIMDARREMFD